VKRWFAATSGVRAGDAVLDLAGGTGDITALLLPASARAATWCSATSTQRCCTAAAIEC